MFLGGACRRRLLEPFLLPLLALGDPLRLAVFSTALLLRAIYEGKRFGEGVSNGTPVAYTIHGTGSSANGTPGGNLFLAGGVANQAADAGGDLGLQVAIAGTGTTLTTIMQLLGASGDIQLNGDYNMLPAADNTWSLGSNAKRLKLVRAVTITSGAYLEEEIFPEESESLPVMIRSLARELEAKAVKVGDGLVEGVRHLAKIAMLSARAVVALEERVCVLEERVCALEA